METEYRGNVISEGEILSVSSEEDEFSESTDDSEGASSDVDARRKRPSTEFGSAVASTANGQTNLVQKLFDRERMGYFANNCLNRHLPPRAFVNVPKRLEFCLKDIVPHCFIHGHVFMGLSACGQFLLSYKVCSNDFISANHYSFSITYKYSLYFWVYQPHKPLNTFYRVCLFDDHGVDSLKKVTMTQWKCADSRVLIVHGGAEDEHEDSYITYVKVPRLGCMECKKLRELNDDGIFRWNAFCLKCNLTVHTKYSSTESDREFNPFVNLVVPERVVIVANGFIHMLHVEIEPPLPMALPLPHQHTTPVNSPMFVSAKASPSYEGQGFERRVIQSIQTFNESSGCDNRNNIVDRILADFSDTETDSTHSTGSRTQYESYRQSAGSNSPARRTYDELLFTCSGSTATVSSTIAGAATNGDQSMANLNGSGSKVSLINHRGRRHHRIVTKSYRNGVTTVDLQSLPSTSSSSSTASASASASASSSTVDKWSTYEFSEDNEKCEKISTLRKRRLADKKYEFSEDNSENIIPYTKIRTANRSSLFNSSASSGHSARSLHRPCASPSSSSPLPSHASHAAHVSPTSIDARHCTPPPMHRASPIALQQGFRSPPCSSPVGHAIMRSPSRHMGTSQLHNHTHGHAHNHKSPPLSAATQQMLSFKPLGTLSPLQVSMTKRGHLDIGSAMSPNANMSFMSPRRDEYRAVEIPLQGVIEKPMCTKKFKRRYVEEDDAASVITSEEDDCISPGYHTSLPMEVHGSCYSEMQMISKASYAQLRCNSVVITQHSFDLEAFTYFTITSLCQKNQKTYDVFYDWACELISICPQSHLISCVLMALFSARDQLPTSHSNCLNCSKKLDCVFHRRQYECRILFTWNMESGDWEVLDYGELMEQPKMNPLKHERTNASTTLARHVKRLAQDMANSLNKVQDYSSNLRVLTSNIKKSKMSLIDYDNMMKISLKRSGP